ncbi:EAL domain-containing protein [Methylophaga sp. OBS1]|uniref:two-component system response regulator n=1 Tax=Methylophaga sp. OBS1 TaxID=2991933 RepID=UPI0022533DF6|nr:EAL domain-containing protein [Methylophaga sp. OBS1]MCX4192181.1 EAL domain-containing protein [Methylophaga sp. OBS1]
MEESSRKSVVLIVDDDPVTRMLMRQSLKNIDIDIYEASNGTDAIAEFNQHKPDMTLLDVSMPGMDGFECCERLRQLPRGQECAIVMVTSLDEVEDIERAFQVGATDFMTKPLKWPLFNHRVRYVLKANRTLQELSLNKNKLAKAQSIAHLVYWEWDYQSDSIECSTDMFDMLGLTRESRLTLKRLLTVIHPDDRARFVRNVRLAIKDKKPYDIEYRVQRPDGHVLFINERTDINFEYGQWRIVGTLHDITALKQSEQEITYYAYYDTLTDLPNRRLFIEQLETTIASARRHQRRFTLMFLDLDRFKHVNDTYGHHVGDELLCQAAGRIRECVRDSDLVAKISLESDHRVARLAGDEFTVLLDDVDDVADIADIANRLIEIFSKPFVIGGTPLYVTVSIGITVFPTDGHNVQILLQHADVAMYHAKQVGRNNYQFFSESMNNYLKLRMEMEHDLRIALEQEQFELYYQPQYHARSEKIVGFEALLRWRHPVKGLLTPDSFIEIAESTGLILPIGDWVLMQACEQVYQWQQALGCAYRVAINLSALQFNQNYLPERVRQTLEQTGLPPETLELEITETAMLNDVAETIPLLFALKKTGVRLAIDDFGTGYSSMSYLKNFPIDTLKIDRSFVEEIVFNRKDAAIAQTIVQLANNLHLSTIAEGVETEAQAALLLDMGCEEFQGFYFSKPMPVSDLSVMLTCNGHDL